MDQRVTRLNPASGESRLIIDGFRRRIVDEMVDAYVDWREECVAVDDAYECWQRGPRAEALFTFAAYHAALDYEERAAERYAELVGQLSGFHVGDLEALPDLAVGAAWDGRRR
jgi:hypothetical protein